MKDIKIVSIIGIIIIGFSLYAHIATVSALDPGTQKKYIVVLKDTTNDTDKTINDIEKKHGVAAEMRYSKVIKGFSVGLTDAKLAKLKSDSRVAFVSEDRVVTINGKPATLPVQAAPQAAENHTNNTATAAVSNGNADISAQSKSSTGPVLPTQASPVAEERVSADGKPGNKKNPVSQPTQPTQPAQTIPTGVSRIGATGLSNKGTGVGVAIIDTGIDLTHPDLAANIGSVSKSCVTGTTAQDDNGHGTHVAGTIAALGNTIGVVGVAPEAKLYAVKVLDKSGSGTWSSIICGIDWVTANAQALNIKVANMSLGGVGTSDNNCGLSNGDALHRAICNSTAQGVTYVVAAGNSGADVSQSVPASYDDTVVSVSALVDSDGKSGGSGSGTSYGSDDTFASFSNYGSTVDIAAPGVSIYSTWMGGGYNTISGTSMASPHAAGAAALYLKSNPSATWLQVRNALRSSGEPLGAGHVDPSGLHMEPVLKTGTL